MTESTAPKQPIGRPFQPGESGNPAGRPIGARSRYSEAFIQAYADDFEKHGDLVIKQVRKDHPVEYLKIGQKLFAVIAPKDITITNEMSPETMNFLMAYRLIGAAPDKALLEAETIEAV